MKSNKKKFIIISLLFLCLISAYYVIAVTFISSKNDSVTVEKAPSTLNEPEVVYSMPESAAPQSTTGTPVESTEETPGDTTNVQDIISDQTTSVFNGTIDKQNIAMAIYRNGNELTASLFTTNEAEPETKLLGTLNINTSSFLLTNEDGSITLEGSLKSVPSKGDLLTGLFKNSKDKSEADFNLSLSHSVGSTFEGRYPLIEADAAAVENFAQKIKLDIMEDKKQDFADLIDYPINVSINNEKISIHSSEEFIQHYNDIITSDFKNKLTNSYTKYLFSNSMGVMLGDGEIWFDLFKEKGFRIYGINN